MKKFTKDIFFRHFLNFFSLSVLSVSIAHMLGFCVLYFGFPENGQEPEIIQPARKYPA